MPLQTPRWIFIGEAALRRAVGEFVAHYHEEPNHQGLNNEVIILFSNLGSRDGAIRRKERLGGMLNYYYRLAA